MPDVWSSAFYGALFGAAFGATTAASIKEREQPDWQELRERGLTYPKRGSYAIQHGGVVPNTLQNIPPMKEQAPRATVAPQNADMASRDETQRVTDTTTSTRTNTTQTPPQQVKQQQQQQVEHQTDVRTLASREAFATPMPPSATSSLPSSSIMWAGVALTGALMGVVLHRARAARLVNPSVRQHTDSATAANQVRELRQGKIGEPVSTPGPIQSMSQPNMGYREKWQTKWAQKKEES